MLPHPTGCSVLWTPRRRLPVEFTEVLRQQVEDMVSEMHQDYRRGYTPKVKPSNACNACSLKELCIPRLMRTRTAAEYLRHALEEQS